jgi:hypothetical protein
MRPFLSRARKQAVWLILQVALLCVRNFLRRLVDRVSALHRVCGRWRAQLLCVSSAFIGGLLSALDVPVGPEGKDYLAADERR